MDPTESLDNNEPSNTSPGNCPPDPDANPDADECERVSWMPVLHAHLAMLAKPPPSE